MRLLNTRSLKLQEFNEKEIPPYCILSNTWEKDEVLFEDMRDMEAVEHRAGFKKIQGCCGKVLKAGVHWVWIDTCCIQKSSSAELSEAINSMYRWYRNSHACFAYLSDLQELTFTVNERTQLSLGENIQHCRWFTRGWTLQEMLAPNDLILCDREWNDIGSKTQLSILLSLITRVDRDYLLGKSLACASVAKRMSWAALRETNRVEDIAYCLLGIFDVNMPLLYGEGRKAFTGLQEEIIKNSTDQSLFAWTVPFAGPLGEPEMHQLYHRTHDTTFFRGILAQSPYEFRASREIVPVNTPDFDETVSITNKGLMIKLPLTPIFGTSLVRASLACREEDSFEHVVAITLSPIREQSSRSANSFLRTDLRTLTPVPFDEQLSTRPTQLFIPKDFEGRLSRNSGVFKIAIRNDLRLTSAYQLSAVYPSDQWSPQNQCIEPVRDEHRPQVAALEFTGFEYIVLILGFVNLPYTTNDSPAPFCNIVTNFVDLPKWMPLEDLILKHNIDNPTNISTEVNAETRFCVIKVQLSKWGVSRNHFLADITFSELSASS
ncbi:MAG: hypothetical protein Q9160_002988 [Pyrenula sp. 1 TL-2023]